MRKTKQNKINSFKKLQTFFHQISISKSCFLNKIYIKQSITKCFKSQFLINYFKTMIKNILNFNGNKTYMIKHFSYKNNNKKRKIND